jgi:hypothetical protein
MKVKYEDGLLEVTVEGVEEPVKRGEPCEPPDAVAEQLLKQGWVEVGSTKKVAAKTPTTPTPVEKENE